MKKYKELSLYEFPIPLKGFSTSNTKVKITVIEPDNILGLHKDEIELQVKVAGAK